MIASIARRAFLECIARPEREMDLPTAALLIAQEEYPDLELGLYKARLDRLAEDARARLPGPLDNPFAVIDALNGYLFEDLGFRGNSEEYFDPRNSYLNEVLDRRRGIPVTLSIIYMEVARKVGFSVEGVGFPGHFIVRHVEGHRQILIDPFHGGQILLPDDCRRRLRRSYGADVNLETRFFDRVSKRQILARILINLKNIHMNRGDHGRALAAIERLLALTPGEPHHIRDRGLVHVRLGHFTPALVDLERYLRLAPDAGDAGKIRSRIKTIHHLSAMLN